MATKCWLENAQIGSKLTVLFVGSFSSELNKNPLKNDEFKKEIEEQTDSIGFF